MSDARKDGSVGWHWDTRLSWLEHMDQELGDNESRIGGAFEHGVSAVGSRPVTSRFGL